MTVDNGGCLLADPKLTEPSYIQPIPYKVNNKNVLTARVLVVPLPTVNLRIVEPIDCYDESDKIKLAYALLQRPKAIEVTLWNLAKLVPLLLWYGTEIYITKWRTKNTLMYGTLNGNLEFWRPDAIREEYLLPERHEWFLASNPLCCHAGRVDKLLSLPIEWQWVHNWWQIQANLTAWQQGDGTMIVNNTGLPYAWEIWEWLQQPTVLAERYEELQAANIGLWGEDWEDC